MMITKMALPRRTFLRGIGATLALPLLDAMVPAGTALARTAAKQTPRVGFIYIPNGANMAAWTPPGDTGPLELSRTLQPLANVRDHVVIPTGLDHRQAEAWGDGNGEHSRACTVWLSGIHPKRTEGADVRAGTTADQIAAATLGQETPLPSLELALENSYVVGNCDNGYSCVYSKHLLVAHADDAAPDGAQPARRLRAAVRRGRNRGAAGRTVAGRPEHPGRGA